MEALIGSSFQIVKSSISLPCAVALFLGGASYAVANEQTEVSSDCYDAVVKARIVAQVPSVVPDCGPDCIIMVWPWFLDLDVSKILVGDVPRGRLQALIMLHTYYRKDLGIRRWWLRRNTLGGFNVLRSGDEAIKARCAKGSTPAKPYIDPGPDKTLSSLRAEGERRYRAYQADQ